MKQFLTVPERIVPFVLLAIFLLIPAQAMAHSDAQAGGFFSGLVHPVAGWDHVVAMVAVGLWGAVLGQPAIWVLPVAFPLMMVVGAIAGLMGLPLPYVETGIALSALVLGLLILFTVRPPLYLAMIIVGVFAIFHGYAHGAELPESANPVAYAGGFVLATGLLHVAGIALGALKSFPFGDYIVRGGGALIALTGVGFLTGMI